SHFIGGLSGHFRNLLVAKDPQTVELLEVSGNVKERYLRQSENVDSGLLLSALNLANQCELHYKNSKNPRLQVELALLKMCHIGAAIRLDSGSEQQRNPGSGTKKKTTDLKAGTKHPPAQAPVKNPGKQAPEQPEAAPEDSSG